MRKRSWLRSREKGLRSGLVNKPLLLIFLLFTSTAVLSKQPPVRPFESAKPLTVRNEIDRLVFDSWKSNNIRPARLCADAVFVRRVFLDVIGTLPTAREARSFLRDRSPDKRSLLIDRLLQREEFADYWAMKWGDLLRVKAEFPINLWPNAVQAYHRWIRTCIRDEVPYDRFAREMLTASGSNFRVPPVNFYRAVQARDPISIAKAVALTFMGERAEHWSEERLAGLAAFFAQLSYKATGEWKEEIVYFDPGPKGLETGSGGSSGLVFPDGTRAYLEENQDPREVFAIWLISPQNPWFGRNIVNRIWYWLLGRGIVHEPDDFRADNPAGNPELLAWLNKELNASQYDLKHIYRLILNSTTYQLSSIPGSNLPDSEAQFSYYPLRRLEAEVLMDTLCQITGTSETYSSAIPEPFTFIPEGQRSIALADGSITSAFLEMFGRPPRDTGLLSERDNRPTATQRLYLLNSTHIQRKIERSRTLRAMARSSRNPREAVNRMYLTILSRFPTDSEFKIAQDYATSGSVDRRGAWVDLAWALINSPEFLYRH